MKRLWIAFLAFSFLGFSASAGDQAFREALGLYWSGRVDLAVSVLKKSALKTPEGVFLLALSQEALGRFSEALREFDRCWRFFPPHEYTLYCAVEEAAIRAYVFDNPIGAAVALEIAAQKLAGRKKDLCVLLDNLIELKIKAGLNAEPEEGKFRIMCSASEEEVEKEREENAH